MPTNAKEIKRSVRVIRSSVRGKVHASVLVRVNNICLLIEQVLPRADELGDGSHEMHTLSKMATDYLPAAINPYLALPRDYAERTPLADGRTATAVLCAQLDVMHAQMWQVVEAILRRDGDRLLANERFLEDKFGGSPLGLPPDPPGRSGYQHPAGYQPSAGSPTSPPRDSTPDASKPTTPPLSQQLIQAATALALERMRSRKKPK